MPYENGVDLVDRDYGVLGTPTNLRSIRFKQDSFSKVRALWNRVRRTLTNPFTKEAQIERVENKLENKKEEFQEMEFKPNEFNKSGTGVSKAEEKILKKATAIARLEEKLNILRDIPTSPSFVNSRAIKLKDNMIRNARFNSNNAYSVPEERKYAVFEDVDTDSIIKEEANKTAQDVRQMLNDKNIRDDIIVAPDRGEIKKTVDHEFERQEKEYIRNISAEEVADITGGEVESKSEEASKMADFDPEELRTAVSDALNKVNVDKGSSVETKIEKYGFNEDGTYRYKKEQLDEDFRKTPIIKEPSRIETSEIKVPRVDPSQVLKPATPEVKEEPKEELPFAKEEKEVRLGFDNEEIENVTKAADKTRNMDDIQALLERVKVLKEKQNESKQRAEEAKEEARKSEQMKKEAQERLQAYADALNEDLGYNERSAEEDMKKVKNNEDLIEAMLGMIQPTDAAEENVRAK